MHPDFYASYSFPELIFSELIVWTRGGDAVQKVALELISTGLHHGNCLW
ncbi:hypothetical protein OAH34_00550 [bacterium]|nr:hypothetical protein [bacterium]